MRKILPSLIVVGAISALVVTVTNAYFSDRETSSNNLFQTGKIDLKIDNESYYNGAVSANTSWEMDNLPGHLFFNFNDVKPSDWGEDTISLHVDDNDAWACAKFTLTKDDDNTCSSPEMQSDPTCNEPNQNLFDGELGNQINMVFWADDGDNVWEENEPTIASGSAQTVLSSQIAIADSANNIWGNTGPLAGTQDYFIAKGWCFGSLSPNQITQDNLGKTGNNGPLVRGKGFNCDGTQINNSSQSDLINADIEFTAYQHRNNPNFLCFPSSPTPTPTATATPIACVNVWANNVESSNQGTRKNGTAVLATRSNPTTALVAQTLGNIYDSPVTEGTFYSLGFKLATPNVGGSIVVSFTNPILNGPGNDLKIYEVTGGSINSPYPDELIKIEASLDGITYTTLAASAARDATVDLGILTQAKFVRITDVSPLAPFESTADAYDLDGVQALCGQL